MAQASHVAPARPRWANTAQRRAWIFRAIIAVPSVLGFAVLSFQERQVLFAPEVALWLVVLATLEFFPVPTWAGNSFSVTDPLLIAFAILYPPAVAFCVNFAATSDPREWRHEVGLNRALFNRGQVALSLGLSSAAFHSVASVSSNWPRLMAGVLVMTVVFYVVNLGLAGTSAALYENVGVRVAVRQMLLGTPLGSGLAYLSFGCLGGVVARLYVDSAGGYWVLVAVSLPLLFLLRQPFLHFAAVQREAVSARQRERLFRDLADETVREREDERQQIAGALHDEVIPLLQAINIHAVAGLHTALGEQANDLERIRGMSSEVLDKLRHSVYQLRQSTLGAGGLAAAVSRLVKGMATPVSMELGPTNSIDPQVELVLYQIAREALRNAEEHSDASTISLRFSSSPHLLELEVSDDGHGFDSESVSPDHFGLTLMKERAAALGGRVRLHSSRSGTVVAAEIPTGPPHAP